MSQVTGRRHHWVELAPVLRAVVLSEGDIESDSCRAPSRNDRVFTAADGSGTHATVRGLLVGCNGLWQGQYGSERICDSTAVMTLRLGCGSGWNSRDEQPEARSAMRATRRGVAPTHVIGHQPRCRLRPGPTGPPGLHARPSRPAGPHVPQQSSFGTPQCFSKPSCLTLLSQAGCLLEPGFDRRG